MATSPREDAAMFRALDLARRGPATGPNPRVGCVLIDVTGATLAEGWHRGAGTAHAEADALAGVPPHRRADLAGATAVVTLEPCNHSGRTPPCADALADAGITRVVYAVPDPNPEAGEGLRRSRPAASTSSAARRPRRPTSRPSSSPGSRPSAGGARG